MSRRLTGRVVGLIGVGGLLTMGLASFGLSASTIAASPAAAVSCPAGTTQHGAACTKTFGFTGDEQVFTLPTGVRTVFVTAIGGLGGTSATTGPKVNGGHGASVSGYLTPLTPMQTLFVEVGGAAFTDAACPNSNMLCHGGFNGGGSSVNGGGGGGASEIRTCSRAATTCNTLDTRLIVAAGGGGAGSSAVCAANIPSLTATGGVGGDAGSGGGAGGACLRLRGGTGGGAGTASMGGVGGTTGGRNGGRVGGDGTGAPRASTGAGGGGLYGGGSGGQAFPGLPLVSAAQGGGGGGSNLVPTGGLSTIDKAGLPQVAITWGDFALHITALVANPHGSGAAPQVNFRDDDPTGTLAQYSGTISWGDKTTSTISNFFHVPSGGFAATSNHGYPAPGTYTITATINDIGGASASQSITFVVS